MAALPNDKLDCAAILIASSLANSYADVVARKNVDKDNKKGNLIGPKIDVANMYGVFMRSKIIKVVKTFDAIDEDESKLPTKTKVLRSIDRMFQDTDRKIFLLYYSGHGRSPSIQYNRKGGDWVFEGLDGNGNKCATYITINHILFLWDSRTKPNDKKQRLVIIADCCYSGGMYLDHHLK